MYGPIMPLRAHEEIFYAVLIGHRSGLSALPWTTYGTSSLAPTVTTRTRLNRLKSLNAVRGQLVGPITKRRSNSLALPPQAHGRSFGEPAQRPLFAPSTNGAHLHCSCPIDPQHNGAAPIVGVGY